MVQETIDSYYLYLVGMGFDPPKDLPPLGLVTGSSIPLLRAVYDNHALQGGISVGADSGIEGPAMAYGFWAFYRLLEPEPIYDRQMYLSQAQHQLWQYFGRVFLDRADRVPDWPTKGGNWLPALLEIRRTCGAYFTDHSLALVVKVIREYYKPNEAQFSNRDQFLAFYLKFAESLIEDPHDPKTPCSDAILLRNGLLKPTK
jgi:hypothetical protein